MSDSQLHEDIGYIKATVAAINEKVDKHITDVDTTLENHDSRIKSNESKIGRIGMIAGLIVFAAAKAVDFGWDWIKVKIAG